MSADTPLTQAQCYEVSGYERIGSCDCCEFDGLRVTATRIDAYGSPMTTPQDILWYCDLCRGTLASNFHRQGRPEGHVLAGMAFMVNTLLKAMRDK